MKMIKHITYKLLRKYGVPGTYIVNVDTQRDLESGLTTANVVRHPIRILLFPRKMTREFEYDIAYLASNKNFTYGAYYDMNKRLALISKNVLPAAASLEDSVEISGIKYNVLDTETYEDAIFLTLGRINKDATNV